MVPGPMLAGLAIVLITLALGPAAPSPELDAEASAGLSLHFRPPPGCPGFDELATRVSALMPEIPLVHDGAIEARAELRQLATAPERWRVTIEITSAFGRDTRSFEAESCLVATEATALVIAVAVDPVRTAQQVAITGADPEAAAPKVVPLVEASPREQPLVELEPAADEGSGESLIVTPPREPPDKPGEATGLRVGLALLGGGGYGPLRAGSAAVFARVALIGRAWRWELRGAWLPPVVHELGEGRRARFDGWLVGTRGCRTARAGAKLEVPLCAGIEAGAVRGRPIAPILNRRDASQPWVAAELGPALSWSPIPALALGVELSAVIPVFAAGFALDGEPVLRYSPVGVRALAGLELRLPRARNHGTHRSRS